MTENVPPHVRDRAVYLGFGNEPRTVWKTRDEHESVLIDVDRNGKLIGVEVLDPPGIPRIEYPPHAVDPHDAMDHEMGVPFLRDELAATRRIVAEWLWNSGMGRGTDPDDLRNAFEQSGRGLDAEFDAIEEREEAEQQRAVAAFQARCTHTRGGRSVEDTPGI